MTPITSIANLAYNVRFYHRAVVILSIQEKREKNHRKNHRNWSWIATREKNKKRISRVHVFLSKITIIFSIQY